MLTILHRDRFYEVCPRCGLSRLDYLIYAVRFPCGFCRNGKRRAGEVNQYSCGGADHGSRS